MSLDLDALARRLPPRPLTRFAPSPTGWLHLGHIVNAIYTWGVARALGGRVVLRIEDHDRERSRPEYERGILEDLEWLGLMSDEGCEDSLRATGPSPWRQSDRGAVYERALTDLQAQDRIYACRCSRRQIARTGGSGDELRYPGTCRAAAWPREPGTGLRVVVDPGVERFEDGRHGPQAQEPASQCGDLLVYDRQRQWTYQFAVVVDDRDQQIDLVIRGDDLLASAGRQIQLARLLGRAVPPVFVHHPLVYGAPGVKLSKSNRDAGIRELRAAGRQPADVLGMAAAAAGLIGAPRPLPARSLAELFA